MIHPDENRLLQRVLRLFRRHIHPQADVQAFERLTGGASQATYKVVALLDQEPRSFALRLTALTAGDGPLRSIGLRREALLMQAAGAVGVPAPEILHVLEEDDELGEGFLMNWLDGETLGHRIVRSPEFADLREKLASECGRILAQIHAIDVHANGIDAELEALSPETYVHRVWDDYKAIGLHQPMIDYTARWLLEHLPRSQRLTLVHNDFRNGNLMVNERGVVAVLDWELAHIGHPLRDLGWICTGSWRFGKPEMAVGGFGHREDLIAAYEAESGVTVDREELHFWEVFGSYWWAVGCLRMGQAYRDGDDATVERAAIGRRSSECQADCVNLLIPGRITPLPKTRFGGSDSALPSEQELLESVVQFLGEASDTRTDARTKFLDRVAANSLGIVARELTLGEESRKLQRELLGFLVSSNEQADLPTLTGRLVEQLRDGSLTLRNERLITYLRNAVFHQLAIDQPQYKPIPPRQ